MYLKIVRTFHSSLESSATGYQPPAWHAHELARRQRLFAEGKIPVYDWSEVQSRLEARRTAL